MGTASASKIKTARKPATGDSYPCAECGKPIHPGDEYFCYQLGQRWSKAFCLECARTERDAYDANGNVVHRPHHRLYEARYGVRRRGSSSAQVVRSGRLVEDEPEPGAA